MKSMSINATIKCNYPRVAVKRNKIQGRPKTNNKKRLSLGTVLQNKFENSVGKSHPSHLLYHVVWNFCSNIIKPAYDWMTEYRLIFFHLFCICLYIRFYTNFYRHPPPQCRKENAFLLWNRIKGKSKSRKLLLFPLITQNKIRNVCVLWSVITNQFNGIDNNGT